jgi:hypothetical protein
VQSIAPTQPGMPIAAKPSIMRNISATYPRLQSVEGFYKLSICQSQTKDVAERCKARGMRQVMGNVTLQG